ncbi:hypothetical protein EVAR_13971_1 [Eumeta japonica]|uniref:Uncharacterized protein n=1 Tax=Eumeta variegata TaxID=151549 RepID=A0A4C1U9B3_EUMVA|nr:hypothetical protein EVAR_13971_1 [Eumeta japonica]
MTPRPMSADVARRSYATPSLTHLMPTSESLNKLVEVNGVVLVSASLCDPEGYGFDTRRVWGNGKFSQIKPSAWNGSGTGADTAPMMAVVDNRRPP